MENTIDKQLAKDADKYIVRMPAGMREQLALAAKQNNRSMNAEIVLRLQRSLDVNEALPMSDTDIDRLAEAIAIRLK